MNEDQQRYFKRAIINYGMPLVDNIIWFIDEGFVYYGKEANGEVKDYLSGFISGNAFVVLYSTDKETLDTSGWNDFITSYLDMNLIDARH